MNNLKLVKPSIAYKIAYLEMIDEWKMTGEAFTPWVLGEDASDFSAMILRFENFPKGIGIPEGFVPHSTFWLVRNDKKMLGAINIRHTLNPYLARVGGHIGYGIRPSERRKGYATEMLRLGLFEAKELGISQALVSCDKANIPSAKTIINNGGQLESEIIYEGEMVQRYRIDIKDWVVGQFEN